MGNSFFVDYLLEFFSNRPSAPEVLPFFPNKNMIMIPRSYGRRLQLMFWHRQAFEKVTVIPTASSDEWYGERDPRQ